MSIQGAFVAKVLEGGNVDPDQIHPVELPTGTKYPAATYQVIYQNPHHTHKKRRDDGKAGARRTDETTIQVTSYAEKYIDAVALDAVIVSAVDEDRWTADGTKVMSCLRQGARDLARQIGARQYGISREFVLTHVEVSE